MPEARPRIPLPALVYGLAGLIPFAAPAFAMELRPDLAPVGLLVELIYGAVILSFLGGARWGFEVRRPQPRWPVITLSMAPSVTGFFLVLSPPLWRPEAVLLMAAAFALQYVWDLRSADAPAWYPRLRLLLSLGAIASLAAAGGVALLSGG